ncbi:long-chain-fatty-acid--CoA ligase [Aerosticca soli]|uniref:Medium-chain-fatty-acid--CoA ligase n=1 Tax=Aerosticca soli TaxID=2010829 RepID=A0A2Z6E4C5_9GAMM|nr:long-chain-fatty-acid--CoA ligase [Aerosticca soli]BBD79762.1 medium-chain-fatty-acid--CoA ligase [Aerosticca soli]
MLGLMQHRPLLISSLIEHAETFHPRVEIVSRSVEGPVHRTDWASVARRARQVANALAALKLGSDAPVATLAWNTWRHLELYYGVSGAGVVLHTVNPRLSAEQIGYIINHAEDEVLFFDLSFGTLVQELAPQLKSVKHYVVLTDRAHMPELDLPRLLCYEELIEAQSDRYTWPSFDENTASSLCYTSGTTGHPKGVLYSHRSTVLHSMAACAHDGMALGAQTSLLLVVPMFHVNGWGAPYACAMAGAKLVLPGPRMDGENLYGLIRDEGVTFALGVPTVWLMLLQYLDQHPELDREGLKLEGVAVGGSALPRVIIERFESELHARAVQLWGMTETSPLGVSNLHLLPAQQQLPPEQQMPYRLKQGRGVWGVEIKIVDDEGHALPWDGRRAGHLMVRGPWITARYYKAEQDILDAEGFFPTGDIATVDPDGYVQLVDRAKDVIKSGGEWISSIELENIAVSHPGVAEAAVIGIPHPKWQERPLLLVVRNAAGAALSREELLAYMEPRVPKWWLPDEVVFVESLPHTATGKLLKSRLRELYQPSAT